MRCFSACVKQGYWTQKTMALGKVPKIYMGWGAIIIVGLGAFVAARTSVSKNRYTVMKTKERIREETRAEQEQNRVS